MTVKNYFFLLVRSLFTNLMSHKNIIIALIIFCLILIVVFGSLLYTFWQKIKFLEKEKITPIAQIIELEDFDAGTIGEISEKEIKEKNLEPLPPAVFSTTGTIKEIKKDSLIVQGDGTNFADQQARELTLIFTAETITFEPGQKVFYQGAEGLKYLKPGMEILVDSEENIRGKNEFQVKTINLI